MFTLTRSITIRKNDFKILKKRVIILSAINIALNFKIIINIYLLNFEII